MRVAFFILIALFGACSRPQSQTPPPPTINVTKLDDAVRNRVVQLQTAVVQQPQNADAWGNLGQALHALEFNDKAAACYTEAARLDPQSGRWPYFLGQLQLLNDPTLALTNLARAVSLLPATNDAPRLTLAKALAERGREQDAARELETILSANPTHAAARLELARLKLAGNNAQAAADLLQPCLTNQFTARPAHLLLGQAKLKLGDARAAAQLSQRAAVIPEPFDWPDPYLREMKNSLPLRENLLDQANRFLASGRAAEAEKLLNIVLQQDLNHAEALLILGRLRAQQQRFAEAESHFQKHLAAHPNSVQGWMQLGIMRFRQEQWPAAAEAFKKATEIKPDYAEAHGNLAFAYSRQNQTAAAIQSLKEAIRCQPGDARAHASLAEEFLRANQKPEALAAANAALAINPQEPKALRVVASLKNTP
jgi:tetratricopeptide (TPR) repeat protein